MSVCKRVLNFSFDDVINDINDTLLNNPSKGGPIQSRVCFVRTSIKHDPGSNPDIFNLHLTSNLRCGPMSICNRDGPTERRPLAGVPLSTVPDQTFVTDVEYANCVFSPLKFLSFWAIPVLLLVLNVVLYMTAEI